MLPRWVRFALGLILLFDASICSAAQYGAIAYSTKSGASGWAYNAPTRELAEQRAMDKCKSRDCKVAVWFFNNCGALAVGPDGALGGAYGETRQDAETRATRVCGNEACRPKVWVCNKLREDEERE